jgi:diphosphomevalonate decarboxylase
MHAGSTPDGSDSFAESLLAADTWPLEVVIAVTERGEKSVSSRAGMEQSALSSPYYSDWVATSTVDLDRGRRAVLGRDFEQLTNVAEHSCLKMHAVAMTAQPPLVYWNATTVACMHVIWDLRHSGVPVFFTIDAGPQLKAVCAPGFSQDVEKALRDVPGVLETLITGLGPGIIG